MAFEQHLTVRFEEVDYAQYVYFPRILGYCHWVFEDFFAREIGVPYAKMLQERGVGFPAVHTHADFKNPLRFGDRIAVRMETVKLGRSSIRNRYRIYLEPDRVFCAEIEVVQTAMSMQERSSVEIPEDVRAAFAKHLAE